VQPRRQFGAFFKRELFDCVSNFNKAHMPMLPIARLVFQVSQCSLKVSIVGSDRFCFARSQVPAVSRELRLAAFSSQPGAVSYDVLSTNVSHQGSA
jgi:hypothetical protein